MGAAPNVKLAGDIVGAAPNVKLAGDIVGAGPNVKLTGDMLGGTKDITGGTMVIMLGIFMSVPPIGVTFKHGNTICGSSICGLAGTKDGIVISGKLGTWGISNIKVVFTGSSGTVELPLEMGVCTTVQSLPTTVTTGSIFAPEA